jgi:hypothetical protein
LIFRCRRFIPPLSIDLSIIANMRHQPPQV